MLKFFSTAAAVMALTAGAASASPVTFDITGGGFILDSGFGNPSTNKNDFLGVATSYTLGSPSPFLLSAGGSITLPFGSFTLQDDNGTLNAGEQDNLDVTEYLDFTNPFTGTVSRLASTASVQGTFSDAAVDLSIVFDPIVQAFGNGGSFTVLFDSMHFTDNNQTADLGVKITLNTEPAETPEPSALVLLGSGLIAAALVRRRFSGQA